MRNVAVLFGGPSLEHDISVMSGREVLAALEGTDRRAIPVRIGRDGAWTVDGERFPDALAGAAALHARDVEACFLALHGPFGEDGTVQAFLETAGLPYTGSGPAASALARDKIRAKRYLSAFGLPGAPDRLVPPAGAAAVREALGFPVVVKDPLQGSTLGLELCRDEAEFEAAVRELGAGGKRLLVERREVGREFTAPVLEAGDGDAFALPLVEIVARGGFFDFDEKYGADGAEEICSARLDAETTRAIQACAVRAHEELGLRAMSRSDLILRPDGSFVLLETNSIPGLTKGSLFPQSAAAAGWSMTELVLHLLDLAVAAAPPELKASPSVPSRPESRLE